MKEC